MTITHRAGVSIIAAIFGVLLGAHVSFATTTLSQGYTAEGDIPIGSVVSLVKDSTDTVQTASAQENDRTIGIAINNGSSVLSLDNGSKNQVQVTTAGVVPVLVSDCNGKITLGDPVTASPLKGVGMVATSNVKIVGIAQGDMVGETKQKVDSDICDSHEVTLGQVPVLVSVANHYKTPEKTIIPAALQNVANSIAGKKVSSLPIIISAGIFLITIIIVSSIIYSMIRSSIISVGRNPLSQSAVYRDVIQLSGLVIGILGVAIVAIYLVLTRL